ncbi:MAG: gfo/Idh/MocA family oxidoreductase, partial [Pirellulales bacterium]|nr:gfo/Idh/MocA family oxidoreductase [Pirellulales bacterium]
RQVRTGAEHGHIYDHFAVEFEYPGGITMFSQARQINGCQNLVSELLVGTAGRSNCKDAIEQKSGERWRFRQREASPYRQEHEDLIASIREGKPLNEAHAVAESTMTGILGREAAYSGQAVAWDDAMKSSTRLGQERYEFGSYPTPDVPMPGRYRFS